MSKSILVIYHRADFDGIFSCEIARLHFGDAAEYLGWDYGDPVPVIAPEVTALYMIDISVAELMGDGRLTWIDHHKSAMAQFPESIPGWRIDGVAACRLAWQYFFGHMPVDPWPTKEDFVERRVSEPYAVRLAGEYDVWDHRDPNAVLFQHGLRTEQALNWRELLKPAGDFVAPTHYMERLLTAGRVLQEARERENKSVITQQGFDVTWEGLRFLACNAARYNSFLFTAGLTPEHDGCLGFNWNGKQGKWKISLYGVPGKPDIDFSVIAKKYGGGGHKQACGFEALVLPFYLNPLNGLSKDEKDARLIRSLEKAVEDSAAVEKLSDRELSELVIEKVWGKLTFGSPEDWLLDQLVTRFEKAHGIERDGDGKLLPFGFAKEGAATS